MRRRIAIGGECAGRRARRIRHSAHRHAGDPGARVAGDSRRPRDSAMTDELWRLDATELAQLIRFGRASSREATRSCLARLHAVNPKINAVVRVLEEEALAAAT